MKDCTLKTKKWKITLWSTTVKAFSKLISYLHLNQVNILNKLTYLMVDQIQNHQQFARCIS